MENKRKGVSFIHSISLKVALLSIGIVILSIIGSISSTNIKMERIMDKVYSSYILSMAEMEAVPECARGNKNGGNQICLCLPGCRGWYDAVSSVGR